MCKCDIEMLWCAAMRSTLISLICCCTKKRRRGIECEQARKQQFEMRECASMHLCLRCSRQCSGIIKYIVNCSNTQLYSVVQFVRGKYRHDTRRVRHIRCLPKSSDTTMQIQAAKCVYFTPFMHMRSTTSTSPLRTIPILPLLCVFWRIY